MNGPKWAFRFFFRKNHRIIFSEFAHNPIIQIGPYKRIITIAWHLHESRARQILYADQVGADRAPHTPSWVWAGLGRILFLFCFMFFIFLFPLMFYVFYLFMIQNMLKSEKCLDSEIVQIQKNYTWKTRRFEKCLDLRNIWNLKLVPNSKVIHI
jgi:hypothetical protein